jgi:hypothetical protein
MGTTESPLQSAGGSALRVLTKPWVDRVLAAVAMVPFVRSVYLSVSHHNIHMNIPSVLFVASMLVIIGTTLFRKAPCA